MENDKSKQSTIQVVLQWTGKIISIVLVGFLLYQLWQDKNFDKIASVFRSNTWQVLLSTATYVGAVICGSFSWHVILQSIANQKISPHHNIAIFLFTQIHKYLPTNVFHYVGRYFYLKGAGLPRQTLITATLQEISLVISTGALVSLPTIIRFASELPLEDWGINLEYIGALAAGLLLAGSVGLFWLQKRRGITINAIMHYLWQHRFAYLVAVGIYLLNFALLGIGLWAIVYSLNPDVQQSVFYFGSAFAAAWTLGLVTPGASAGIGVREGVLVILLSPVLSQNEALLAAAIMRLVSIIGDILVWGIGIAALNLGSGNQSINKLGNTLIGPQ